MQTSQRGSVLLTIIGGIVILALLGIVAVSLMTGSVMTGLDAKETVQASYLAESGKEIVRVQTAQLTDGAVLMETVDNLNGSSIPIKNTGDVTLTIYPYWFNTENTKGSSHTLIPSAAKWYGKSENNRAIDGTVDMLLMNANEKVRAVYRFKDGTGTAEKNESLPPSAYAVNAYLIGRCTNLTLSGDTLTATPIEQSGKDDPSAATDSFAFFPSVGGLLSLVEKRPTGESNNIKTALAPIRFTYTKMEPASNGYTFSGISPLDGTSLTRLNEILRQSGDDGKGKWDVALGQYFRVVSEAQTTNGARAALVWHTNGRSSFLSQTGGGGSTVEVLKNVSDSLSDGGTKLFGDAGVGKSSVGFLQNTQGAHLSGLNLQGLAPMWPYHFLLPPKWYGESTDFWFARLAQDSVYKNFPAGLSKETSDLLYQITMVPHASAAEFFSGLLFKTKPLSSDLSDTPGFSSGVSGLGLGIVRQKNTIDTVADPFLLPGYEFDNKILIQALFDAYCMYGFFLPNKAVNKTFLVLWAYDDGLSLGDNRIPSGPTTLPDNAPEASTRPLRWLAIGELTDKDVNPQDDNPYCTTLAARVTSDQQGTVIQAWIKAKPLNDFEPSVQWPDVSQEATQRDPGENYTEQYRKIKWIDINNAFAAPIKDQNGVTTSIRVKRGFAQHNMQHDRAGIFSGRYKATQPASWLYFTNFAVGIPGSGGGDAITPGLTPGIVQ